MDSNKNQKKLDDDDNCTTHHITLKITERMKFMAYKLYINKAAFLKSKRGRWGGSVS